MFIISKIKNKFAEVNQKNMTKIEICCDSINSLKKSVDMGVSRIELCSELSVGGLTPSYGFIKEALKYSKDIPIRVLIRPKSR